MSRKPAERSEQEQLSLTLPAKKQPEASPPSPPSSSSSSSSSPSTSTSTSTSTTTSASATTSETPTPQQPRIYAVNELLKAVRLTLESRFTEVRVEGEVSGMKRSGNGHIYFTLKDAEGQLDCVLFSREASRLKFSLE